MSNNTSEQDVVVLIHEQKLQEFIPVIVCLSLLSFVGIVGNGFAIGFYGFHSRRTPTVFMITCLAIVDLLVCVILIHAIIEIGVNVFYTNRGTCKFFHFLIHWAIAASALILMLISVDRYRRICQPLRRQIELSWAKRLVVIVVSIALALSIRDFFNFDIIEFDLGSIKNGTSAAGHYCTITDNPRLKLSVDIFLNIDAILFVGVMAALIFTYGRIVWTICRTGSLTSSSKHPGVREEQKSNKELSDEDEVNKVQNAYTDSENVEKGHSTALDQSKGKLRFKTTLKKSEKSITLLMFIVSIGFFVCFVPYFIIKIGLRSIKRASDLELNAGTQFGIRLVYVNSFLNPLIFCVFNPQFRKYVTSIVYKCKLDTGGEAESSSQLPMAAGRSQTST